MPDFAPPIQAVIDKSLATLPADTTADERDKARLTLGKIAQALLDQRMIDAIIFGQPEADQIVAEDLIKGLSKISTQASKIDAVIDECVATVGPSHKNVARERLNQLAARLLDRYPATPPDPFDQTARSKFVVDAIRRTWVEYPYRPPTARPTP